MCRQSAKKQAASALVVAVEAVASVVVGGRRRDGTRGVALLILHLSLSPQSRQLRTSPRPRSRAPPRPQAARRGLPRRAARRGSAHRGTPPRGPPQGRRRARCHRCASGRRSSGRLKVASGQLLGDRGRVGRGGWDRVRGDHACPWAPRSLAARARRPPRSRPPHPAARGPPSSRPSRPPPPPPVQHPSVMLRARSGG